MYKNKTIRTVVQTLSVNCDDEYEADATIFKCKGIHLIDALNFFFYYHFLVIGKMFLIVIFLHECQ